MKKYLLLLLIAGLFFMLYDFFTPHLGGSLNVHYSERYYNLLKKDGLTEDEIRFIDQENERVRLEAIDEYKKWKENNRNPSRKKPIR